MATKKTKTEGANNGEKVITWVDKIVEIIEEKGIKNIVTSLIGLFVAIVIGYYAYNPEAMVIRIQKIIEQQGVEEVERRMNADPEIRSSLITLRTNLNAGRAFLFETHNGGANLTGLKFLYVDMTYDEPLAGMDKRCKEYLNMRTSSYPVMTFIYENDFCFGPIEEIRDIDPEVYHRLNKAGVKYIGMLVTYGHNKPSGCIGVTFYDENIPDKSVIKAQMKIAALTISDLLDAEQQ